MIQDPRYSFVCAKLHQLSPTTLPLPLTFDPPPPEQRSKIAPVEQFRLWNVKSLHIHFSTMKLEIATAATWILFIDSLYMYCLIFSTYPNGLVFGADLTSNDSYDSDRVVSLKISGLYNSTHDPICRVSKRFVSYTLDWWRFNEGAWPKGWGPHANVLHVDLSSEKLRVLVKELGPSILRIGGSLENDVVYDMNTNTTTSTSSSILQPRPHLNTSRWDSIHEFARHTNSKILFGLSYPIIPTANETGKNDNLLVWNSSQALALMKYSRSKNYSAVTTLYGFELGEELSSKCNFTNETDKEGCGSYIRSYKECASIILSIWPDRSHRPRLMGPSPGMDWPRLSQWFPTFLDRVGSDLDVAVYHSYNQIQPYGQRILYLNDTIPSGNLSTQNKNLPGCTGWQGVAMNRFAKKHKKPLWIGEFGPHNGGGGHGTYSSTFASSFTYIDALSSLARLNHKVLARQTLVGGNYELLRCTSGQYSDPKVGLNEESAGQAFSGCDFEPNPDYWVALLWKRLMGQLVLNPPTLTKNNTNDSSTDEKAFFSEQLHLGAHCTIGATNGSITVSFSNVDPITTYILELDDDHISNYGNRTEYILHAYNVSHDTEEFKRNSHDRDSGYADKAFGSRILELNGNGVPLSVGYNSTKLPLLVGQNVAASDNIVIPPVTLGFLVYHDALAKACMKQTVFDDSDKRDEQLLHQSMKIQ